MITAEQAMENREKSHIFRGFSPGLRRTVKPVRL
jgi:hypothetical protein